MRIILLSSNSMLLSSNQFFAFLHVVHFGYSINKFSSPALVIELKNNLAVDTSIDQIKKKNYPDRIKEYIGNVFLVGITYNDDKHHECVIEKI